LRNVKRLYIETTFWKIATQPTCSVTFEILSALLQKKGNNTAKIVSLIFGCHGLPPVVIIIEAPQASSIFFINSFTIFFLQKPDNTSTKV